MRIAFVATGGFDPGGRERVIPSLLWLVERLSRSHEVVVYVLRYLEHERRYALGGATIQDLGRPDGLRRQYAALAAAMDRDGRFDVVHAYWGLPAGLIGTLVAARRRVPSIVTLDSGELVAVPDAGYGLQRHWQQRLGVAAACRLATRVTVCTKYYADIAKAKGIAAEIVPLGVDTSIFTPPSSRAEGPPWRLIHVASLNAVKNQAFLLHGIRRLADRHVDVHLDIIGEDTLSGSLHALASEIGVASRVTFHGFQPSERLVPFYQRAHAAVLTSHHEAAGVVTLEAAACGVPTVGTNVGYVSDWAPSRAIAVPSGNPDRLADALVAILGDERLRERLAASAREWALAHNADWTAGAFNAMYSGV